MVSYAELEAEDVFHNEYIPFNLLELRSNLIAFFGWSGDRIGLRGDNRHLWGYHRSRAWIQTSQFCTNREASVIETEGNRNGGNPNAIAGMDIVTNQVHALAIYTRVNTARLAGRLPMLRQVILERNPDHAHLSFDRGHLDDNMQLLFQLITGQLPGGQKMVTVRATMPELRKGSSGPHVMTWQTLCNLRGATLAVDGDFGPLTDGATRELQRMFAAESIDGIVGPETWVIGLAAEDQV